jgi:selenocysteine lyase/cysteine desulfurase
MDVPTTSETAIKTPEPTALESYFEPFRREIIGNDLEFETPFGRQKMVYADWIASGRLYRPIEEKIADAFGPYVGNTHSESNLTGTTMTHAYHEAQKIIKRHVNASHEDVIIACGTGMTGAVNKLHRIMGLRVPDLLDEYVRFPDELRPVVFVTHMEHHSNQTSWLETFADVVVVDPDERGLVNPDKLREAIEPYSDRKRIVGAFTSCSNVTGIETPYRELSRIIHEYDGIVFVDFAASAPYADIDMHPPDPLERLDGIYFSPHKFLGGPGSSGVLIFHSSLYHSRVPDNPGGGTVSWTNPWGGRSYFEGIEEREDGGTPGFLQAIRSALCIQLKEKMGADKMRAREEELLAATLPALRSIPGVHILADHVVDRLGIISFYSDKVHYNLMVKLLNDRYGIQVRGGCSCAGTYGHYLLHVDPTRSRAITDAIDSGDLSMKPGWVRFSLHPTMTNEEVEHLLSAIRHITDNVDRLAEEYEYSPLTNEYVHKLSEEDQEVERIRNWFEF